MKSYKEIADSVLARRDEYLAEKKRRKALFIKRMSVAMSCMIVLFIGIGVWRSDMLRSAAPDPDGGQFISGDELIEEPVTTGPPDSTPNVTTARQTGTLPPDVTASAVTTSETAAVTTTAAFQPEVTVQTTRQVTSITDRSDVTTAVRTSAHIRTTATSLRQTTSVRTASTVTTAQTTVTTAHTTTRAPETTLGTTIRTTANTTTILQTSTTYNMPTNYTTTTYFTTTTLQYTYTGPYTLEGHTGYIITSCTEKNPGAYLGDDIASNGFSKNTVEIYSSLSTSNEYSLIAKYQFRNYYYCALNTAYVPADLLTWYYDSGSSDTMFLSSYTSDLSAALPDGSESLKKFITSNGAAKCESVSSSVMNDDIMASYGAVGTGGTIGVECPGRGTWNVKFYFCKSGYLYIYDTERAKYAGTVLAFNVGSGAVESFISA